MTSQMIYSIKKDLRLRGLSGIGSENVCGRHVSVPLRRFNFSAGTLIEIYTKLKCKAVQLAKTLKAKLKCKAVQLAKTLRLRSRPYWPTTPLI